MTSQPRSHELTFVGNRVSMILVKRTLKNLTVSSLIFLFAFGAWCGSMADSGMPVGTAVPCCLQGGSLLEKAGCDHPSFFCAFRSVSNLLSQGAFASIRSHDFSKNAHPSIIGVVPTGSSDEIALAANGISTATLVRASTKVSIHLFNSVLTL